VVTRTIVAVLHFSFLFCFLYAIAADETILRTGTTIFRSFAFSVATEAVAVKGTSCGAVTVDVGKKSHNLLEAIFTLLDVRRTAARPLPEPTVLRAVALIFIFVMAAYSVAATEANV